MKLALILLFFLLSSNSLLAESLPPPVTAPAAPEMNACINGNLKNQGIIEMLSNNEAQLVMDYYEAQGFGKNNPDTGIFVPTAPPPETPPNKKELSSATTSLWQICCSGPISHLSSFFGKKNEETIQTINTEVVKSLGTTPKAPGIKRDCIEASLKREINQKAFICKSEMTKAVATTPPGPNGPCVNDQYVDYIHFAVNRALSCLSPLGDPIDPAFIFQKMNNESGFNLNLAYEGGSGLGQLTSDPVEDLTGKWVPEEKHGKKTGRKIFQLGSGRDFIMERMANTDDPKCKAFAEIAKRDLHTPPGTPPFEKENFCRYGSIGNGVSRSLLYGIGYYLHMRENVVKPALRKRDKRLLDNKRLINLLTLVSYGPGGPRRSEELVQELRMSGYDKAAYTEKRLISSSDYLKNTEKTMGDMLKKLPIDDNKKDKNLGGVLCVSQ